MSCGCISGESTDSVIYELQKGKNPEQKKVIEYFLKEPECGCGYKTISDDEYEKLVRIKAKSHISKEKALSKLGVDEDQVNEIQPVMFEGYSFKNAWYKRKANGNWVSSAYQISWLFFSSNQVYLYQYIFNMDDDKKSELTEEYFYRDVTSFSTRTETELAKGVKKGKISNAEIESNKFMIIVPGASLTIALDKTDDDYENIIQGMKQKLREKKEQQ